MHTLMHLIYDLMSNKYCYNACNSMLYGQQSTSLHIILKPRVELFLMDIRVTKYSE